jgi:PAS domain S-box-containing protein
MPESQLRDNLFSAEQIRLLYEGTPSSLIANLLLAGLLTGLAWHTMAPPLVIGWLLLLACVLLLRGKDYRHYRSAEPIDHDRSGLWLKHFRLGVTATGACWGFAGFFLFPENNTTYQVFLAFVVAGVSAGAITSLSVDRHAALGFVLPALLPLMARFALEGDPLSVSMGVMVALFLLFVAGSAARVQRHLHDNVELRAETAAKEARLRGLFELSPVGIALNDMNTGDFVEINDALIAPTGYTREEFLRLSYWDITPRDYEAREAHQLECLEKTGRYGPYEKEYIHKDGSRYPVLLNGMTIRDASGKKMIWSMIEDISKRKENEQALREKEERLRELFEEASDGIFIADLDGRYTNINSAGCRMLGFQREALIGKAMIDLIPAEDADRLLQNRDTLLQGQTHVDEWRLRRKDGNYLPVEISAKILPDGRWQAFVRDITERKRVEQLKNEFISTVSHELRTPLTSISGALGLLEHGVLRDDLPPRARDLIHIAHRNSQRLSLLINDLLDMEKLAVGEMEFDLQVQPLMPLVDQAIHANRTYAEQFQVHLKLTAQVDDAKVRVDAQRLQQILANLLSNAAKFSPPQETVELAVSQLDNSVQISVTDHGPGIPEAFKSRIFQKFAQADASDSRQKGGTGLGLAISRELIERMQGNIGYESTEGQGSRFYIDLPLQH